MVSALGSFCRQATDGAYRFDHTGAVWRLLRTITINKIRKQGKRRRPEIQQRVPIDSEQLPDREPSPEEVAEHANAIESFLKRFNPRDAENGWDMPVFKITLDTYSHVLPTMQKGAAEKLDRLFG